MEKVIISQTSIRGSAIIFERLKLIKIRTGIATIKDIATASSFRAFNFLNKRKTLHKNMVEMTDILMPIGKIKLLNVIRLFSTYRKGIIKALSAIIVPYSPFSPNFITGKNVNQTKTIELIGKRDHVKAPEIAMSQIAHTTTPIKSKDEKAMAHILCKDLDLLLAVLPA